MKLLDLLAKLGILRCGARAAVYRTAAERPSELMMDDVFDAKRDLLAEGERDGKADDEAAPRSIKPASPRGK
jgi:hypothetical protein